MINKTGDERKAFHPYSSNDQEKKQKLHVNTTITQQGYQNQCLLSRRKEWIPKPEAATEI
jgi:hypothetical protein